MTFEEISTAIKENRYLKDLAYSEMGLEFRIMGRVENYFMVRRKGKAPFVLSVKDFEKRTGKTVAGR